MRLSLLSLVFVLLGCTSYLRDDRIRSVKNGESVIVETEFDGNCSIEALAYSREVMVFTDRIDELLGELASSETSEERREQIQRDLNFICGLRDQAKNLIPEEGIVRNNSRRTVEVKIIRLPASEVVASFRLISRESKRLGLLPGHNYQFKYFDPQTGREWQVTKPVLKSQPWQSMLRSSF